MICLIAIQQHLLTPRTPGAGSLYQVKCDTQFSTKTSQPHIQELLKVPRRKTQIYQLINTSWVGWRRWKLLWIIDIRTSKGCFLEAVHVSVCMKLKERKPSLLWQHCLCHAIYAVKSLNWLVAQGCRKDISQKRGHLSLSCREETDKRSRGTCVEEVWV